MKKIIHAIFNCMDCSFISENYLTARKKAYAHAKNTGHYVHGETAYALSYGNPKQVNQ